MRIILSLVALGLASFGCSAGEAPESASSDFSESSCPRSFSARIGDPHVRATAPTTDSEGQALTDAERAQVDEARGNIDSASHVGGTFTLSNADDGVCFYLGAGGQRAALRGDSRKPVLQLPTKSPRMYVVVSPRGSFGSPIAFAPGDTATLAAVVGSADRMDARWAPIGVAAVLSDGKDPRGAAVAAGDNPPIMTGVSALTLAIPHGATVSARATKETECTLGEVRPHGAFNEIDDETSLSIKYGLVPGFSGCDLDVTGPGGFAGRLRVGLNVPKP